MTTAKINLQQLRQLIKEEIQAAELNEAVDHKGRVALLSAVSKLMDAIDNFKEKATPAAVNAMTPHLGNVEKALEDMAERPGSYVPAPKKEPQKVTLKATKAA